MHAGNNHFEFKVMLYHSDSTSSYAVIGSSMFKTAQAVGDAEGMGWLCLRSAIPSPAIAVSFGALPNFPIRVSPTL